MNTWQAMCLLYNKWWSESTKLYLWSPFMAFIVLWLNGKQLVVNVSFLCWFIKQIKRNVLEKIFTMPKHISLEAYYVLIHNTHLLLLCLSRYCACWNPPQVCVVTDEKVRSVLLFTLEDLLLATVCFKVRGEGEGQCQ